MKMKSKKHSYHSQSIPINLKEKETEIKIKKMESCFNLEVRRNNSYSSIALTEDEFLKLKDAVDKETTNQEIDDIRDEIENNSKVRL